MSVRKIARGLFLCLALIAFCSTSYSQNYNLERSSNNWPGNLAGRSADMLYNQLNLTADQYNQVYTSFYSYYSNQSPDILGNGPYNNWSNQRTTISGYLTPTQVTTYSTIEDDAIYNPIFRKQYTRVRTNTDSKTNTTKTGNEDVNKPNTTDTK